MIYSTTVEGNTPSSPSLVFTSSTTGDPIGGLVVGQTSAITNIILCNTLSITLTDETINDVNVNVYLKSIVQGKSVAEETMIVSNLNIPAGETVFFSDEKIVLSPGDQIWVGASEYSAITVTVSALAV